MTRLFLYILLICQVPLTLAFIASLPTCAQSASNGAYAASSCASITTTTAATLCICASAGLLSDAAAAIYKQCGCSDLETSAQVVVQDCTSLGTTSALSQSNIIKAGCGSTTCESSSTSSTSPSSSTSSSSSQPSSSSSSSSSGLSTGDIVGIVSGVIAFIGVIIACLQLAASRNVISQDKAPSRYIKQVFCCSCCTGGYMRNDDVGGEKFQPVAPWHPPAYQQIPHQDIPLQYHNQWGANMSTTIR